MQEWTQALQWIREAERISLFVHIFADGDAVGSAYGLAHLLRAMNKDVLLYAEEPIDEKLLFLADTKISCAIWEQDSAGGPAAGPHTAAADRKTDLSIAVDCSDEKRLGGRAALFFQSPRTLRIDHHAVGEAFAACNICNPAWAATAEGMLELAQCLGFFRPEEAEGAVLIPCMTDRIAEQAAAVCFYTGLVTDTGCFAYSNVTPDTHFAAALLLKAAGQSLHWIGEAVFESKKPQTLRLYAKAYGAITYYCGGKIAFLRITEEDLEATETEASDTDGLSATLRGIQGVHVGVLAKPGKVPGEIRFSLRSDEACNVSEIAAAFGGGGHAKAAGCVCLPETDYEEFKAKLIAEIAARLHDEI